MSQSISDLDATFQQLRSLRALLLKLHKALLDAETLRYQQEIGPIESKGHLLQLVMNDDWFGWLHTLSQFIVQIDEAFSPRAAFTLEQANALVAQAQVLLTPMDSGTPAQQQYFDAIQRDAAIAQMHSEWIALFD
jgi:hypothetical protein